jgi:hypothetical protein
VLRTVYMPLAPQSRLHLNLPAGMPSWSTAPAPAPPATGALGALVGALSSLPSSFPSRWAASCCCRSHGGCRAGSSPRSAPASNMSTAANLQTYTRSFSHLPALMASLAQSGCPRQTHSALRSSSSACRECEQRQNTGNRASIWRLQLRCL